MIGIIKHTFTRSTVIAKKKPKNWLSCDENKMVLNLVLDYKSITEGRGTHADRGVRHGQLLYFISKKLNI